MKKKKPPLIIPGVLRGLMEICRYLRLSRPEVKELHLTAGLPMFQRSNRRWYSTTGSIDLWVIQMSNRDLEVRKMIKPAYGMAKSPNVMFNK
jgi:hypothetical protein